MNAKPLILTLIVALMSFAATGTMKLTGTVQDSDGGAIQNARVTLAGGDDAGRSIRSGGGGEFVFEALSPGTYALTTDADNFEPLDMRVTVSAGVANHVAITMQPKRKTDEMTVSGERAEVGVDPGANANAAKLEESTLRELPAPGQNIMSVLSNFLSPAAQGEAGPSVVIDGVETSGLNMPTWGIKRIRINKNPYAVQYRRPGNARVEVTTRNGDPEDYHGGVAVYARNSALDARNPLAASKPDLSRRTLESRIMGPVPDHDASFLVSAEQFSGREPSIVKATTPQGLLTANVPASEDRTMLMARLDLRRSELHTTNLRYTQVSQLESGHGVGGFKLAEQAVRNREREHVFHFADRRITLSNIMNEMRVVYEHGSGENGAAAASPGIKVNGAFIGGPSSTFRAGHDTTFKLQNTTTIYRGAHTARFGGQFRPRMLHSMNASNFAGAYEFASLGQFAASTPFVYRVNRGNPEVDFRQNQVSTFVQDEIKLLTNVNVTVGARQEWHGNFAHGNGIAPRASVAWAPGKNQKTVLRGGAGMFFEEYPRLLRQRTLLYDGARIREFVVLNPSYPHVPGINEAGLLPSITAASSDLTLPRVLQASIGVERELNSRIHLTLEYQHMRGSHLLRSRNANAPDPATGIRPDSSVLNRTLVESNADMRSNALNVTLRWNTKKRFSGMAQYSTSRTMDDAIGLFSMPADSYDLRPEWGRSDYDKRHHFSMLGAANLPGRLRLGTVITLSSAAPYNITTGFDNNGDTFATDRPVGVTRNTGQGPGLVQVDIRLSKLFDVHRIYKPVKKNSNNLELSVDTFNVLNRTNFAGFNGQVPSPFFGRANQALSPRTLQMSFKYHF